MKNRITPILVIIILSMTIQFSFGQDAGNNYGEKKSSFFKQYKDYLNALGGNKNAVKPVDPNGLFYVDESNKFRSSSERTTTGILDNIQPITPVTETVAPYLWTQTSGAYTPIAGTTLGTSGNDDEIFAAVPIGFTFVYDGLSYTTVGISNNGYLKFGATPSNSYTNILSTQTTIYAGFHTDLIGNGSTSSLSYTTTGVAPNRIFTVQWSAMCLYNSGADASVMNFQMTLSETTNKIATIFGAMTVVTLGYTPQCGINTTTSDFNIRTTATDWSATTAGGSNTSNCVLTNTIKPASGQTWTWGPPPLCGTYTIPGSYASFTAAITDLNSRGVCGTSPVIFNIAAGYTDLLPVGGFTINITANLPTSAGPVIFQRNGAGTNPLLYTNSVTGSGVISGSSVGSNGDAFFRIVGTDYISFKNIDLRELYTGAVAIPRMEYGFLFVRGSSTNGCKNDTLSGCVINMQRINIITCGISSLNIDAAGVTTNPTTTDGRHENINVQGCTVNNSLVGMYFAGYAALTPYDLYDHSFKIGTVTGNTLSNIGSVGAVNTNTHYGIYSIYHDSLRILNNTINVNTGLNAATHYGIFTSTGTNSSCDITNNTVSDTSDNTVAASSQQAGIWNTFGATGTDNVVNITNNTVRWCRYFSASSASAYYIANTGSALYLNITGNTVDSNKVGGQSFSTATGIQYGIYNSASNLDPLSVTNISGNTVRNLTRTQSVIGSGTCYGMYISSGGRIMNVFNNTVNDLYNSTTGTLGGLYTFPSANIYNVYGNTVRDLRKLEGGSGAMYCLYYSQSTPITVVYNNQVYNITCGSSTSTSVIYGMYNNGSPPAVGGIENVNNNTVHDITHMGTTASTSLFFVGIYSGTGTTGGCDKVLYGNSVYNVTTNYGQTGGIYMNYADTAYIYKNRIYNIRNTTGIGNTPQTYGILMTNTIATAVYFTYNNFISELYADMNPTFPAILGIWHNGTLASGHYYNTIYLNATSSGTNFGTMALYIAGTTTNVDLRNNIVVNKSVATGTGATVCLFRADTTTTNYNSASNNNNFYAGTPSAQNLIYLDPSISTPHAFQTISDFKTYVAPRENNSFTEDSPFLNTTTHPYNLHMSTVIPTACEGGGIPISAPFAITTDYDGNTRNAVTPDVGADEFAGLPAVITVNLNVVPGGFYNSATGKLRMRDTVRAYLVDSAAGCLKVDSAKGVLDSVTFLTSFTFNNASNGNYFLVVKHRNHVVISSSNRITVTRGAVTAYNFTDAGTKAYGSNMIQVSSSPVVWGMLPGDINQDQFVDGLDQTIWVGQSGLDGYLRGDLNGDGFVDGLDQSLWVPYSGLGSIMPCGFTRPLNTKQFDGSIKIKDNQQPNEGKKINRK